MNIIGIEDVALRVARVLVPADTRCPALSPDNGGRCFLGAGHDLALHLAKGSTWSRA